MSKFTKTQLNNDEKKEILILRQKIIDTSIKNYKDVFSELENFVNNKYWSSSNFKKELKWLWVDFYDILYQWNSPKGKSFEEKKENTVKLIDKFI